MKIVAVTNRKGGVGKSTIATHISAGLATMGYNVGLVDTDSQGHCSLMMGMPEENGLFNLLIEKRPMQQAVRLIPPEHYSTADHPSTGNLYLIPSSDRTYQIPHMLKPDESFLFLQTMEQFAESYSLDVIIIDTNPTMSLFDGAIYLAADGYIYVTECERLSFDGIQKAIEQMERFGTQRRQYLGRESRILGIIPNKLRADTRNHRHNISKLAEVFPGLVWTPLILRTVWTEATNAEELVYTYAPTGQEADDAWRIVEKLAKALQAWQTAETN
jgi:chromosome partitioning protein